MLKSIIFFFISMTSLSSYSTDKVKEIFPQMTRKVEFKILDSVSAEKNNTQIFAVYNKKKLLGFVRPISTTTGCNSACLPLNYETFYSAKGDYISLYSEAGLTKINHEPFSKDDYSRLEILLAMAPQEFSKISHPKELTDAISGATLKDYVPLVVKGAAYSTLRIHLYNQETLNFLKD